MSFVKATLQIGDSYMSKDKSTSLATQKGVSLSDTKDKNTIAETVQTAKKAAEKIKEGLSKPTASTGTPMSALSGAAKTIAGMSNIGGGSIATGGDGILGGLATVMEYQEAVGQVKQYQLDEDTKKSLPSSDKSNTEEK